MKQIFYFFLAFVFLTSCNDEVAGTYASKPVAMGRLNDVVVVADNNLWEGAIGDTFKYYFESAYPIMPNPEPLFDLRHFTSKELNGEPLRKELRTYIILADLSDNDSPTSKMVRKDVGEERFLKAKSDPSFNTTVGKDKWARGQVLVYLFGKNETSLTEAIKEKFSAIASRIKKHDEEQMLAGIYTVKRENAGAIAKIKSKHNFDIKIPGDYEIAVDSTAENFTWLKRDDNESSSNIIIREYKYENQSQLSLKNLVGLRDQYGKSFISGPSKNSYMVTNVEDLPVYEYTLDINGNYAKEIRGVWEMENDFMGGPFITYAILDQEKGRFIFVDVFVYAPGKDKRDMVQQLEYIVTHSQIL